jgi:hypothetical protein
MYFGVQANPGRYDNLDYDNDNDNDNDNEDGTTVDAKSKKNRPPGNPGAGRPLSLRRGG